MLRRSDSLSHCPSTRSSKSHLRSVCCSAVQMPLLILQVTWRPKFELNLKEVKLFANRPMIPSAKRLYKWIWRIWENLLNNKLCNNCNPLGSIRPIIQRYLEHTSATIPRIQVPNSCSHIKCWCTCPMSPHVYTTFILRWRKQSCKTLDEFLLRYKLPSFTKAAQLSQSVYRFS